MPQEDFLMGPVVKKVLVKIPKILPNSNKCSERLLEENWFMITPVFYELFLKIM